MKTLCVLALLLILSAGMFLLLRGKSGLRKTVPSAAIFEHKGQDTIMNKESVTFGAGCFWCVEAVFQRVNGVLNVSSGYMGGTTKNPTYEDVCTGMTGHAEVCRIEFNPETVSFKDLLEIFWKTHDPTTLNRQGNDVGTQYRSVIFYGTEKQKEEAEYYKQQLEAEKVYANPIVTEIAPESTFYKAEDYHQDYYNNNRSQGYCAFIITPKIEKFKKVFARKYNGE